MSSPTSNLKIYLTLSRQINQLIEEANRSARLEVLSAPGANQFVSRAAKDVGTVTACTMDCAIPENACECLQQTPLLDVFGAQIADNTRKRMDWIFLPPSGFVPGLPIRYPLSIF